MKRFFAACLLALGALTAAHASERYVIRSIVYEVEGRTRQYFIEKLFDAKIGDEFPDRESLDAFIEDRLQILMNERVLESAEIIPAYGEPVSREGEAAERVVVIPVDFTVRTKDTWNLIGLPYFNYDSNVGLLLALRGRDYNFFGTMEPLILNVNWRFDNDGEQTPGLEARFSLPFRAVGLDWTRDLDTELTSPDWQELDFAFDTGITAKLPLWGQTMSVYAAQGIDVGAEDSAGLPYDDSYFLTSSIGAYYSWDVLHTNGLGDLVVQPKVNLAYRWRPGGLTDTALAETPVLTPSIAASIGRVNWKGNFREGFEAHMSASFPVDLSDGSSSIILSGNASGFLDYGFFGPSARISGFTRLLGSIDTSAGDPIRGVLNNRIKTSTALFLNLDFPFRVIRFRPADWFGISWMRYFHFEQHWSPFIDVALVESEGRLFSPSDAWIGAGLEVITYPTVSRSFFVRISAGWDLRDVIELKSFTGQSLRDGRGISEFSLGVGHFY